MEYFRSGLKTVLGSQPGVNQPSGAETVERLIERVQTSTLLEDRRDACRALKSLSKKFRVDVGAQGMDTLIRVLETDRNDAEIVGYALDALTNVIVGAQEEEDFIPDKKDSEELGVQFTEIYIKKQENVSLLLDLLEEYDFKIRWPAVKLLIGLLTSRPKELQECILVSPMGVSRLMDLLSDTREIIRNDTLLLLVHLTKANANIQKIVAFENAFDRLLDVIAEEGFSDGGVVVEDCLLVLLNLLKNNTSNQTFFKEGSYIQRLTPFFDLQGDVTSPALNKGWSAQKVSNVHLMLQVIRTLVSPNNPLQVTSSCQKAMNQCGLLEQLTNVLMASGVPADILTETINTVAEVIRGHHGNQEYMASVTAPSNPPRPAIEVLLMSMVNERQPFPLRCAVLYCFQSFLYKNELGQAQIIQTLLPASADMTTITAGQLLCGGLFSSDPLLNWCAAVALSHALVDSPTQKEQLLRVQLATSVGNPPVSLMAQCSVILQQGGKVQTRLGLLTLMCTWLAHCTTAVSHFLRTPTNVPFLTSQVSLAEGDEHEDLVQGICAFLLGICVDFNDSSVESFTKEHLCQIIMKRIGLETFLDKLNSVAKNEVYSQASQRPQLKPKQPNEVLLDHEFCRLFKSLEGSIIKAVQPKPMELANGPESHMTPDQHVLVQQYKTLIREQDQQLSSLRMQLEELQSEHQKCQHQLHEMTDSVQQLRDQNALLKAHKSANSGARSGSPGSEELAHARQESEDLRKQLDTLKQDLQQKDSLLEQLQKDASAASSSSREPESHQQQDESNESLLQQQEVVALRTQLAHLEDEVKVLREMKSQYELLEQENKQLQEKHNGAIQELANLRTEQEDLLVLLSEQDTNLNKYKAKLKELGEKFDEDEDEDVSEVDGEED